MSDQRSPLVSDPDPTSGTPQAAPDLDPAVQVFPSTLAAMGGWPWARLVLFGANAGLAASLSELRVTSTVPLAADEPEARQLVDWRPPTVSRYLDLEKAESSPIRARLFVGAACTD